MSSRIISGDWYCHCCLAQNPTDRDTCRVCGRESSYAQDGFPLPLHGAGALLFRPSQVVFVLDNLFEVDSEGWTPLHSACVNANGPLAAELVKLGSIINAITHKGLTPLHLATHTGAADIVELLVNNGANVNACTTFESNTSLHFACLGGRKRITEFLINHGATIEAKNSMGRTPLHMTAEIGRADLASILIRAGADPNALDAHGWCPRQIAELNGHRVFEELIVRTTIKEKQVVFKELPTAPWHNEVWFEVIRMQRQRQQEAKQEAEKWQRTQEEVQIAIQRETQKKEEAKAAFRIQELQARKEQGLLLEASKDNSKKYKANSKYDLEAYYKAKNETNKLGNLKNEKKILAPPPLTLLGLDAQSKSRDRSLTAYLRERHEDRHRRNQVVSSMLLTIDGDIDFDRMPKTTHEILQEGDEFDDMIADMIEKQNAGRKPKVVVETELNKVSSKKRHSHSHKHSRKHSNSKPDINNDNNDNDVDTGIVGDALDQVVHAHQKHMTEEPKLVPIPDDAMSTVSSLTEADL